MDTQNKLDRQKYDEKMSEYLNRAKALIPNELMSDLPPTKLIPDVPAWHGFEYEIWMIGSSIEQLIKHNKQFKPNDIQINDIVLISTNPCAKRGRQIFIMLLGYKKYQHFADKIAAQISDICVEGHVIGTLYKMQAQDYGDVILPFTTHKMAWIRNKAKKYIEKYGINRK